GLDVAQPSVQREAWPEGPTCIAIGIPGASSRRVAGARQRKTDAAATVRHQRIAFGRAECRFERDIVAPAIPAEHQRSRSGLVGRWRNELAPFGSQAPQADSAGVLRIVPQRDAAVETGLGNVAGGAGGAKFLRESRRDASRGERNGGDPYNLLFQ